MDTEGIKEAMRINKAAEADAIKADVVLPEEVKAYLLQMRKGVRDDAERVQIIDAARAAVVQARSETTDADVIVQKGLEAAQQTRERVTEVRRETADKLKRAANPSGKQGRRGGRDPLGSDIEYHG
jgi:hypothetical protein